MYVLWGFQTVLRHIWERVCTMGFPDCIAPYLGESTCYGVSRLYCAISGRKYVMGFPDCIAPYLGESTLLFLSQQIVRRGKQSCLAYNIYDCSCCILCCYIGRHLLHIVPVQLWTWWLCMLSCIYPQKILFGRLKTINNHQADCSLYYM